MSRRGETEAGRAEAPKMQAGCKTKKTPTQLDCFLGYVTTECSPSPSQTQAKQNVSKFKVSVSLCLNIQIFITYCQHHHTQQFVAKPNTMRPL